MKTKRYLWLVVIFVLLMLASFTLQNSGGVIRIGAESPTQPQAAAALTSLAGYEVDPALAYDPQLDHFLLAYGYSTPPPSFQYSIQAQFVDANGSPLNSPLILSTIDGTTPETPDAAYNSVADEFLVIWDHEYSSTDHDIYARRVSIDGSLVGSQITVDYSTGDDSLPDLAYNPATGEYLAVWERYYVDQSEIYAKRLDATGNPLGSGFYIADDSIDESGAAVAYDTTTGEFLVVWHIQSATDNYDIFGQRVTSGGALSGGVIQISSATGNQMYPQLAYNADADQLLVVWQDERVDGDIYGQRVTGSGGLVGGNFAIADQGSNYRKGAQVAFQANQGEYMVVWSMSGGGEDVNVYRRRVLADGALPEGERLVSGLGSNEEQPTIAAGGELSYLLAWEDERDTAQYDNIYGEVVRLNRLQGKVFEGLSGDESTPLAGVTVGLYGSNNAGNPGTLLESVLTDSSGWFGMIAPLGFEYYSLIETNPATYDSIAASSPGGSVLSMDWIQFPIPLEGKDLSGNRFWDQPQSSAGCGGVFYPTADTSVTQYDPTTPHGGDPGLYVEQSIIPGTGQARTFMTFDLSDRIPPEAIIHSAELELTLSHPPLPAASLLLGTASLPHAWDEATLTWNTQPATSYAFETKSYSPIWSDVTPVIMRVDVSTLVNLWATGVMTPTSLALLPGEERLDFNFYSRESPYPPRLVVHCSPLIPPLPQADLLANARQLEGIERLSAQSRITPTIQLGGSGAVRFALFDLLAPASETDALSRALWFIQEYSDVLRLSEPAQDLQFVRRSDDEADLFFRQRYAGIPILGSEVGIHLLGEHITGLSGAYLSDLRLDPTPHIPAERARQIALALGAPGAAIISDDQLRLLNRNLFGAAERRTFLTWLVVLDQDGGSEYYIDADTGALRLQQPRNLAGFDLDIETVNHNSGAGNSCYHYWWTTDDDHWCDEDGCNSGATQEWINAYNYIKTVYNYWQTYLGRDSYNDDGDEIQFYLNVGTNWNNAQWLGGCDFFEFGDGNAVLDIVGHEFAHGVTDYTSDLVYKDESGALNESFSDINGAFVDGDWLHGEDAPGGASRSLANPTLYGDPDRYNSPLRIAAGTAWDWGGVHVNSGINNHAAYLITEGGDFNGVHIPYGGISMWRARVLFYKTLKRLTSNASMLDARNAAVASAKEMAQQNDHGFTTSMICIVRNAYHAVELGDGDIDCDGIEDALDPDQDGDKVPNGQDNCSTVSNPDQMNTDKDSQGDACDTDDDNDGVLDATDNCPLVYNFIQVDTDNDGMGNACDDNDDGDLVPDAQDNCIDVVNYDQLDTDGDGYGDACDSDDDNDGDQDSWDNCPLVSNPNQANSDGDPFGDACDLCPNFPGTDNGDPDKDGKGNSCDDDDDNDGVLDGNDNCPVDYNPDQRDLDGNGKGWACDAGDAAALLAKLKTLTLKYYRGYPIRIPLPGCGVCGPGYLDPGYFQEIGLLSNAGFHAQITDSSGKIVGRTSPGAGNLLSQSLSFKPAPYAFKSMFGGMTSSASSSVSLAADDVRYYLELFPAEGVDLNQTYSMSVLVQEHITGYIYLPMIARSP